MIYYTSIFAVITISQLAFVTFPMDIYRTDAAIWSQTQQTTTDWQNHFSCTTYQQMADTNIPTSFPNMAGTIHIQLNVSLENLVSSFSISNYIGTCSDLLDYTHANFMLIPNVSEFLYELIKTTWDISLKFNRLMTTAVEFLCTENTNLGHDIISLARI